jgi:hypothetical protein
MHTHNVAVAAWRGATRVGTGRGPCVRRIAAEELILVSSGGSDWYVADSGRAEQVEEYR